jgi:hypothetical protein
VKSMLATWIFLSVLATIALVVARFAQPGRFALELDVYILVVGGLALLEVVIATRSSTAFDLHFRLRPTLREIADERLAARGLQLDRGGPVVEEALGEELWEIVRPDREPPFKRFAPGISPAAAARVVDRLEAL